MFCCSAPTNYSQHLLDSLVLDEHVSPAVAFWNPFPAISQTIENFLPLPHRCTPDGDGILHNIFPFLCPRVDGEASAHKGDPEH